MNERLGRELELFSRLSVQQMEEIAAESQALVDKLSAMAKANAVTLDVVPSHRATVENGASSDVDRSGEAGLRPDRDRAKARRTSTLVAVLPSPAAGVDDVVTGESAEQPTGADIDDA